MKASDMPNSVQPMWFVRAGRRGIYAEHFLQSSVVAIGWGEVGEIPPSLSDGEMTRRFNERWPDEKTRTRKTWADQVKRFMREIEEEHSVVTYDPSLRVYHLGTISSQAELQTRRVEGQDRGEFVRRVVWTERTLRDDLSIGTRNTLGSSLTLFLVPARAADELLRKSSSSQSVHPEEDDPDQLSVDDVLQDYVSQSEELIEDKIALLDWQELQELFAGILRSMGYRTRVSEPGPDRGVDVFASPDGLGLTEPRIFVEVKHRGERIGSQLIRAFLGGRQQGDRCLYVSIGGFTTDAHYEAERSSIPITLIALPELRELFVDNYESLDSVSRSLVPLRRLFLPVSE